MKITETVTAKYSYGEGIKALNGMNMGIKTALEKIKKMKKMGCHKVDVEATIAYGSLIIRLTGEVNE